MIQICKRNDDDPNCFYVPFVYAHGKMEDDRGDDYISVVDLENANKIKPGIFECNSEGKHCIAFIWTNCDDQHVDLEHRFVSGYRGLVVYDDDYPMLKDALNKYAEKSIVI